MSKKTKRLSARHVWDNVIRRKISMDMSLEGPRRDHNFYASTNAIYSGTDKVLFMYTIDGLASRVHRDYKKRIRSYCKEDVRVSFIDYYEPTKIDWDGARMKSKLQTWNKQIKKVKDKNSATGNSEGIEEVGSMEEANLAKRRGLSVSYFYSADRLRGRSIYTKRSMMYVAGYRGESFDKSISDIQKYCVENGLRINRVTTNIESYLKSFSPFSAWVTADAKKSMGTIMLTDEIASNFFDYDHGKVGNGTFYISTDIKSGRAVLKNYKQSSEDPENILVTGITGSGKSAFIKIQLIQFAAADEYRITVMDIEGEEYTPLANYFSHTQSVVRVNMAIGSGSYFDATEIPISVVEKYGNLSEEDFKKGYLDLFAISKECLQSTFRVILGVQSLETSDGKSISQDTKIINNFIDYAIVTAYNRRGVVPGDKNTWHLSSGMRIHDVYAELKALDAVADDKVLPSDAKLVANLKKDKRFRSNFNLIMTDLAKFFEPDGINAHKYMQRVSLNDIATAKMVVCSFGLEGRSANTIDKVDLGLSQISAAQIATIRSIICKLNSKYHVKVFEELNRWGSIPGSYDTINTAITGGRKTGDITILATNKLKSVLKNDILGIFENLTSYHIGKQTDVETIDLVTERLQIKSMRGELKKIMLAPTSDDVSMNSSSLASRNHELEKAQELANHKGSRVSSTNLYSASFLSSLDGKKPIIGRVSADEIMRSPLIFTGNEGKKSHE